MADNYTVINSCSQIITMKSKDVGAGVEAVQSIPTDTAGTPMLVLSGSAVTSTMSAMVAAISSLSALFSVSIASSANAANVLAGSSTITSTMAALVTVLSPNSAGIIPTGTVGVPSSVYLSVQGASNASPLPAADPYSTYTVVASSLTQQSLGSSAGRAGDYLAYVTVFPTVAASGAVTIFDSTGITIGSFAGGATTALPSLVPFRIDIGAFSQSSGWKVSTSSNVSALGIGKFT